MRAVILTKYGEKDYLELREVPQPEIKAGQALIKIHNTTINPVEWKIAAGWFHFRPLVGLTSPRKNMILGADVAGEIVDIHPKQKASHNFKPGDRVYGLQFALKGGAYAEYIAMSLADLQHISPKMSYAEAAGIPLAGHTAYQALIKDGRIASFENPRVLINGASGGVGTYAIQYAKALGAEVTAVCSTRNIDLVKSLGADRVIDYKKQDFLQLPEKYHIVFDVVSNLSYKKCRHTLEKKGRYIYTNFSFEILSEVVYTSLFSSHQASFNLVESSPEDMAYSNDLYEKGQLKTIIDRTFKLSEMNEAHDYSKTGRAVGKIIIDNQS